MLFTFCLQNESQLFAKLMSLNCVNFEFDFCNFSKKHMYSKDRCEEQTKEGCGRVVAYRTCNVIFSYTMECGYHTHTLCQELPKPTNVAKRYGRLGYTESESENFSADIYKQGPPLFTPQIMEQIGRALCVTVLDIFDINPYSRLPNTQHKTLEGIRRETALQLSRNERFRKEDAKCQTKIKRINESIFESYYKQFKVVRGRCQFPSTPANARARLILYSAGLSCFGSR